jgi:putative Mg2+ transporter-C (MgtC) family protein
MAQWVLVLWQQSELALRLLLAAALGGILGWERERRRRPAGLRTFMLVCMGSCLFTILSSHAFPDADKSRIAANILTGIGFIGAGTVFREQGTGERIRGLTTAAGLWACAGIGMAVGTDLYWLGACATIIALLLLAAVRRLEGAD